MLEPKQFEQIATVTGDQSTWGDTFRAPHFLFAKGLACWAEAPIAYVSPVGPSANLAPHSSEALPWLALHGGPGGATNPDLVYPLRKNQQRWFAFDQRSGGLSHDHPLSDINTDTFVDDALALADHLGVSQFNLMAGSWGATLAMAIAGRAPKRVGHIVLRGPFIPTHKRVTEFFERLRALCPTVYDKYFQGVTDSRVVCNQVLEQGQATDALCMVQAWNALEMGLLVGKSVSPDWSAPGWEVKDAQKMLRKYRLQAYFLKHDCFMTQELWQAWLCGLGQICGKLLVLQGEFDSICPTDGAELICQSVAGSRLSIIKGAGHLAGDRPMAEALDSAVSDLVGGIAR